MDGKSLTPQEEKLKQLQAILPEAFTEGKVDWEKLQATLGKDINFANERYVLNWAGKSDAFKAMQQPSTRTLVPAKDESVDFDTTQNIFIEGENLEVLKILQKSYFGKVKMIYIDPPYNTGEDSFIYPDRFNESKEDYQRRVGDRDEDGFMTKEGLFHLNSKESGQYHSNWLNMMYPRLFLAKNLLRQDGVIFVSIDDNEKHNLKSVLDEIFGEENFFASFIWEKRLNRENRKRVSARHDYILCYTKSKEDLDASVSKLPMTEEAIARYKNPDNDPRGPWKSDPASAQAGHGTKDQFYTLTAPNGKKHELQSGRCWVYTEKVMDGEIKAGKIWFGKNGNGVPRIKTYLHSKERGLTPETIWFAADASTNEAAKNDLKELFGGQAVFETPKPPELIRIALKIAASEGIVLDFFAGSGAMAHAIMAQNIEDGQPRKHISVQLPELCSTNSEASKAGYKTIADIAKDRIRKASSKLKKENPKYKGDLGFKVFKLADSNFRQWQISEKDAAALEEQMKLFVDPVSKDASTANMVYELLLKSGKDLNSSIEKKGNIYLVNGNELALLLEKADQATIDQVLKVAPAKVIALDRLFKDNDQLKTNTALQMKDAGIDFKTI